MTPGMISTQMVLSMCGYLLISRQLGTKPAPNSVVKYTKKLMVFPSFNRPVDSGWAIIALRIRLKRVPTTVIKIVTP